MGKTISQKIFDSHLLEKPFKNTYIIRLDNVFCHEITTPIAINDLVSRNMDKVFDADKIKVVIDHVSPAKDSKSALQQQILRQWAKRNKIKDFFDIGNNGVCHALFPEKGFVHPGNTIIMGDSHTCTYGAFGCFAAGVGTTDLEVGILKGICAFRYPDSIKIELNGKLKNGVYAKDVILFVLSQIGCNGATDCVIEFTGSVIDNLDMEQRMTICNMSVETGATCGICYPDMKTVDYLWPFIKNDFNSKKAALIEYSKFKSDEDAQYIKTYSFDLSSLLPLCTYGYKPNCVKTVKEMEGTKINQVYIGGCTNGRISDLRVAASILKNQKVSENVRVIINPATTTVYRQAVDEGLITVFLDAGCCVTNPSCGACLGMSCGVLADGEVCVSTTNRNFNGRMGKGGMVHLASPSTAAFSAIRGYICEN
ncbi:MAG: 3-isopropylmalate dehydratase large subunit [Treponema sp.]|nr:3-isopropylmalate dehydratase large subunit [Treponema sp.]